MDDITDLVARPVSLRVFLKRWTIEQRQATCRGHSLNVASFPGVPECRRRDPKLLRRDTFPPVLIRVFHLEKSVVTRN